MRLPSSCSRWPRKARARELDVCELLTHISPPCRSPSPSCTRSPAPLPRSPASRRPSSSARATTSPTSSRSPRSPTPTSRGTASRRSAAPYPRAGSRAGTRSRSRGERARARVRARARSAQTAGRCTTSRRSLRAWAWARGARPGGSRASTPTSRCVALFPSHRPLERADADSCFARAQFCPSYPAKIVVPAKISDTTLSYAVKYRSKSRIPGLVYLHWANLVRPLSLAPSLAVCRTSP